MVRSCSLVALALLGLAGRCTAGVNGILSFPLELDERRCFFEEVQEVDTRVYAHVQVTDGGYDLAFDVQGPFTGNLDNPVPPESEGRVVYSDSLEISKGEKRLLFRATQGNAVYRFCVMNGGVMMKAVSIVLKSAAPSGDDQVGPHKPMEPIRRTIVRISEALMGIKEDQAWLKVKERQHRDSAESGCESVLMWSVASVLLVLGVGGTQTWYYNNLFKSGRGSSRGRGA